MCSPLAAPPAQVVVRYHIQLDPMVQAYSYDAAYPLYRFACDLGSTLGYIAAAGVLLNGLRRMHISGLWSRPSLARAGPPLGPKEG